MQNCTILNRHGDNKVTKVQIFIAENCHTFLCKANVTISNGMIFVFEGVEKEKGYAVISEFKSQSTEKLFSWKDFDCQKSITLRQLYQELYGEILGNDQQISQRTGNFWEDLNINYFSGTGSGLKQFYNSVLKVSLIPGIICNEVANSIRSLNEPIFKGVKCVLDFLHIEVDEKKLDRQVKQSTQFVSEKLIESAQKVSQKVSEKVMAFKVEEEAPAIQLASPVQALASFVTAPISAIASVIGGFFSAFATHQQQQATFHFHQ